MRKPYTEAELIKSRAVAAVSCRTSHHLSALARIVGVLARPVEVPLLSMGSAETAVSDHPQLPHAD